MNVGAAAMKPKEKRDMDVISVCNFRSLIFVEVSKIDEIGRNVQKKMLPDILHKTIPLETTIIAAGTLIYVGRLQRYDVLISEVCFFGWAV